MMCVLYIFFFLLLLLLEDKFFKLSYFDGIAFAIHTILLLYLILVFRISKRHRAILKNNKKKLV